MNGLRTIASLGVFLGLSTSAQASDESFASVGQRPFYPAQLQAENVTTLEPFGASEGLVTDPNGGFAFVRFDPPFAASFTIESIFFASYTRNGVPAVFPSVRVCGADPSGRPDLSNVLFTQANFQGSPDGMNTIPVGISANGSDIVFVAIEFPARGPSYPLNHPGLSIDFTDLERGYFASTYLAPAGAPPRLINYVNAIVGMKCSSPLESMAGSPHNLSANRIGSALHFSFEAPAHASALSLPATQFELMRRADFGHWLHVASTSPGQTSFTVDNLPGRWYWSVRSSGPAGSRSQLSSIEATDAFTRVFPLASWDAAEPNGELSEAMQVTLPFYAAEPFSIFPSGDRDFYSFVARPGDALQIAATPTPVPSADRDTLDLAAVLYDERGKVLAFDDNSVLGKFPQIDYHIPAGRSSDPDRHLVVEIFSAPGSKYRPDTVHRPATVPSYSLRIDSFSPSRGNSTYLSASRGMRRAGTLNVTADQANGDVNFLVADDGNGGAVRIFDVRGRLLNTILVGPGKGVQTIKWSGHSNDGVKVARGVYFAAFTSRSIRSTKKFVLAH